eukprot:TRINITY_DN221_c5_g1_i1.p1 TRINITY_DN221_c5_g1~~TRINITY_DN221_c5_g1_i1.p1  ORF type:complete len:1171 (+),score=357.62 TRINITY_DN221_c5_g1_i1:57-3569(+)
MSGLKKRSDAVKSVHLTDHPTVASTGSDSSSDSDAPPKADPGRRDSMAFQNEWTQSGFGIRQRNSQIFTSPDLRPAHLKTKPRAKPRKKVDNRLDATSCGDEDLDALSCIAVPLDSKSQGAKSQTSPRVARVSAEKAPSVDGRCDSAQPKNAWIMQDLDVASACPTGTETQGTSAGYGEVDDEEYTRWWEELVDAIFTECDTDHTGFIDCHELAEALPRLGVKFKITPEQCQKIIEHADIDGNGVLDETELQHLIQAVEAVHFAGGPVQDENVFVNRVFELIDKIKYRGAAKNQVAARLPEIMNTQNMFSPNSVFKQNWDFIIVILIFYRWVASTLTLWRAMEFSQNLLIADIFVGVLQLIDVAIQLNTYVKDDQKTRPISNRKQVLMLYMRGMFWVDFVSLLPIDIFLYYSLGDDTTWRWVRAKNLVYLLRYRSVFKVHDTGLMGPSLVKYYFYLVPMLRTVTKIVFAAHLIILLRAVIADDDVEATSNCTEMWHDVCPIHPWYYTYYYSAWWVWWQMTSQGQLMVSFEAHALAVIVMCFCVLVQSQVMAEMSAMLVQGNVRQRNDEAMRQLRARMKHFGIPFNLQQEVLSFNYHTLGGSSAVILRQYLTNVPDQILQEVFLFIKVSVIEGVHMFCNIGTECTMALANCLLPQYIDPDKMIIPHGSLGAEMYFLMYGHADVMIPIEDENWLSVAILKKGDLFGEVALLKPNMPRTANVQALSYCDLFVLVYADFDPVRRRYQELAIEMTLEAQRRGLIVDDNAPASPRMDSPKAGSPPLSPTRKHFAARDIPELSNSAVHQTTPCEGAAPSPPTKPSDKDNRAGHINPAPQQLTISVNEVAEVGGNASMSSEAPDSPARAMPPACPESPTTGSPEAGGTVPVPLVKSPRSKASHASTRSLTELLSHAPVLEKPPSSSSLRRHDSNTSQEGPGSPFRAGSVLSRMFRVRSATTRRVSRRASRMVRSHDPDAQRRESKQTTNNSLASLVESTESAASATSNTFEHETIQRSQTSLFASPNSKPSPFGGTERNLAFPKHITRNSTQQQPHQPKAEATANHPFNVGQQRGNDRRMSMSLEQRHTLARRKSNAGGMTSFARCADFRYDADVWALAGDLELTPADEMTLQHDLDRIAKDTAHRIQTAVKEANERTQKLQVHFTQRLAELMPNQQP